MDRCPLGLVSKLKRRLGRLGSTNGGSRSSTRANSVEPTPSEARHIIPLHDIILCKKLGVGEFGIVWQGVWNQTNGDKSQVAVKCLSSEKMQSGRVLKASPMDFLHEAAIMHQIQHPNIVRLFGVVLDVKSVMLVNELAPLRSLLECLREKTLLSSFPVLRLCDYAVQIAEGMAFLEDRRFLHRDLAARNILVFSADKVKISDFGLSRALGIGEEYYRTEFTSELKLPIAWCAPECVTYLKFTTASDVWAFGVTLWEMFSYGMQPWLGLNGHQIMQAIEEPSCKRLEMPDACPRELYSSLLLHCWAHDESRRPSFHSLISSLQDLRPEQVQAIAACDDGVPDHLQFYSGQLITVLDKRPTAYPDGYYWKGVLESGRTGLFKPDNTVAYLASDFPASKLRLALHGEKQVLNDGSISVNEEGKRPLSGSNSLRWSFGKGKGGRESGSQSARSVSRSGSTLSRAMISGPQGDFRHVAHLQEDGTYFGLVPPDLKARVPRQIVNPLKAEWEKEDADVEKAPSPKPHDNRLVSTSSETASLIHREAESDSIFYSENGSASSALRFENPMWGAGGSLLDEVFSALDDGAATPTATPPVHPPAHPAPLYANPEVEKPKKPEAVVRPVSFFDAKLLDDVTNMAHKLNEKALNKSEAQEKLREEKRRGEEIRDLQLALNLSRTEDSTDSGPSSKEETNSLPSARRDLRETGISLKKKIAKSLKLSRSHSSESSGSCDSQKKCFSDQLPPKTDLLREVGWSPSAEDAYKSLIYSGRSISRVGQEAQDAQLRPQPHSDPEDPKPSSSTPTPPRPPLPTSSPPDEDSPNPLRMLRSDAAGIARSFKAPRLPASARSLDHSPPPVPPKPKPRPKGGPPPVSPKPSPDALAPRTLPPAVAPKPRPPPQPKPRPSKSPESSSDPPEALDFTMESVDKYELLDFVLAAFDGPKSSLAKDPPKLHYAHLQFENGDTSPGFAGSGALAQDESQPVPL